MNKKSILNLLKAVASFIFMIGILYYFFGKNSASLQRDLLKVNYIYVFLSMIFGAIAYVNRGLRWIVLIDALGYQADKLNSIASVSVGYLTNLFIPRAGEVSRCSSLNKSDNIPVDKLFGTILIERVIDLFFLLTGIFIAFLLNYKEIISSIEVYREIPSISNTDNESSFSFFLIILFVIIIGFIAYIYLSKKKKSKLNIYKQKVLDFINGLKLGFKSIKKIKNKTYFWFHTLSIWIMYFLMTYICFYTIPETYNLGPSEALFLFVLGGIGMVIPSPGGVGSYHVIIMIGLVALQIDNGIFSLDSYEEYNAAMLFPFIVHTGQTFVAIIMGSLGLLALFFNNKKLNE